MDLQGPKKHVYGGVLQKKKAVAILQSMAFYPWGLFCRNHSCVFMLPHLLHLS